MKITRRQLKRIIQEATWNTNWATNETWDDEVDHKEYDRGYEDAVEGYPRSGHSDDYDSGYNDGERDADTPAFDPERNDMIGGLAEGYEDDLSSWDNVNKTPDHWDGLYDSLESFIEDLRQTDADFDEDAKQSVRRQVNAMLDELLW